MPEEKDRYGNKLRDAERGREESYFADRDRKLLDKLRRDGDTAPATPQPVAYCPRDGQQLTSLNHLGVTVDECPACKGMWLDKGELEQIARRESTSWLAKFLDRPPDPR